MNPTPPPDDANRERDPLSAYIDGDPGAVRAARPPEPSAAEWDEVCRRVQARLAREPEGAPPRRRRAGLWLAAAATLTAAAAAVAWVAIAVAPRPQQRTGPDVPEVAEAKPKPTPLEIAPLPHEPQPDPLADFAVLPMATTDEVVLNRVPGDGWLPVGIHPLSGSLSLATADDVELDDPNPAWPSVTPAPGDAPMIFATKPR
jgi:hypothetical protein